MYLKAIPYSIPLILIAFFCFLIAFSAWRKRPAPGSVSLSILIFLNATFTALYAAFLVVTDWNLALWINKLLTLAFLPTGALWLLFAIYYNNYDELFHSYFYFLLFLLPILFSVIALTNGIHFQWAYNYRVNYTGPFPQLTWDYGLFYFLFVIYQYLCITLSIFIHVSHFLLTSGTEKKTTFWVVTGTAAPFVAGIFTQINFSPLPGLNLIPYSFFITALGFGLSLFRYNLLNTLPVSQRAALAQIQDGMLAVNLQNRIVDANIVVLKIFGSTKINLVGKSLKEVIPNYSHPQFDISKNPYPLGFHIGVMDKEYEIRTIPYEDRRKNIKGFLAVFHDITQERRTQQELELTGKLFELINRHGDNKDLIEQIISLIKEDLDFNAVGMRLKSNQDFPFYITKGFSKQFTKTADQHLKALVNRNSKEHDYYDCICKTVILNEIDPNLPCFTSSGSFWTNDLEYSYETKQTTISADSICLDSGYKSLALIPIKSNGEMAGLLHIADKKPNKFTYKDIVFLERMANSIGIALKRKQNREEILKNLKEKESLLREIHHRVKNNMQLISSMLHLQHRYENNLAVKKVLEESQTRIQAMALIHGQLYQNETITKVNAKHYIQNLTSILIQTYNISPDIHLNTEVEEIHLDIDTAIPVGLITSELVSNSLKYAFSHQSGGSLRILLARMNRKKQNYDLKLLIADNGVGIPIYLDYHHPNTLGLTLVSTLVKQLSGKMEVDRTQGTEVRIFFKETRA